MSNQILREVASMLSPLARRVNNMVARGVVLASKASGKLQTLQIGLLASEAKDDVEHFEPYGFTSRPKPGAEHVTVFLDGDRSHGITLVVADRRYRLTGLAEGEAALHDDQGQKVHITRDGIVIKTAKKIRIDGANIELHASQSYSWDVNGFGERWTYVSGSTWQHRTWQTGATVTSVTGNIKPPEGP